MTVEKLLTNLYNEMTLNENAFDFPRKWLDKDIFDSNELVKSKIRKQIMDTFLEWKEKHIPKAKIIEWYFIGSMTTYQYNGASDIDINIILSNITKEEISEVYEQLPNGNLIKDHPINYYLSLDKTDVSKSRTLYNFGKNKWIRRPNKKDSVMPGRYSSEVAKFFMDAIDLRIGELERDEKDLKKYQMLLKNNDTEMEEKEIKQEIERMKMEIKADVDSIKLARYIIKGIRREGFVEEEHNFKFSIDISAGDNTKSINNLIYKELENFGYLDKLENIKKKYEDIEKKILEK